MKIHVEVPSRGKYFRIIASNGKVLAHSETYWSRWNAKRAARKFASVNGFAVRYPKPELKP